MVKTRLAMVVGLLVVGAADVALALTFSGHFAQQNTTTIDQLQNVTGTYGGVGSTSGVGRIVKGDFGATCSGSCCPNSTQNKPGQANILKLRVVWETSDGTDPESDKWTRDVVAKTSLTNKQAVQQTLDMTDPACLIGPPTWNANASIGLSGPAAGQSGASGIGGGNVAQAFAHSTNGSVNKSWSSASPGTAYDDQTSGDQTVSPPGGWVVDPDDEASQSFWVNATVTTTFTATAKEIVVTTCSLTATAKLKIVKP